MKPIKNTKIKFPFKIGQKLIYDDDEYSNIVVKKYFPCDEIDMCSGVIMDGCLGYKFKGSVSGAMFNWCLITKDFKVKL